MRKRKKSSVPARLAALGAIYAARNRVYGDDYRYHGEVMVALFPNGVTLKTVDDFNRYALLKHAVSKIGRYAPNFQKGGHVDSLDDLSVYAQMLQELDAEER